MKQRLRIYYAEAQKTVMWDRWKAGDNLHEIVKLLTGRTPSIGCWQIDSLHRQALETSCRHHWRELLRNDGRTCYRAAEADAAVWERARRPKV